MLECSTLELKLEVVSEACAPRSEDVVEGSALELELRVVSEVCSPGVVVVEGNSESLVVSGAKLEVSVAENEVDRSSDVVLMTSSTLVELEIISAIVPEVSSIGGVLDGDSNVELNEASLVVLGSAEPELEVSSVVTGDIGSGPLRRTAL